jgi:Uma2 family endonuclease
MSAHSRPSPPRMTADEFIAWAMENPDAGRFELLGGEVIAMAAERLAHARAKGRAFRALADAIERGALPCEAFADGVAVRVAADTVFEPDALVRCGPPLPDETVLLSDPVIVVEVLSRSIRALDAGGKLGGYFRLPSVCRGRRDRHPHPARRHPPPRPAGHHARPRRPVPRRRRTLSPPPPGLCGASPRAARSLGG